MRDSLDAGLPDGRRGGHHVRVTGTGHYRALALAALLAVAGCGSGPAPRGPAAATQDWPVVPAADPAAANAVLMRALGLVGTPYRYGGNTPEGGFDCSGLVNYVYRDMLDL